MKTMCYFRLFFIMADVGNLDICLGSYFRLFFIMAEMDNLDICLGVTLVYFHNGKGG